MFLEGLAMRTAQKVFPGKPDAAYTQMPGDGDWLAQCNRKKDTVLAGITADLDKSGREIATKYTFGQGNAGMHREAYCAAWIVMGKIFIPAGHCRNWHGSPRVRWSQPSERQWWVREHQTVPNIDSVKRNS